MKLTGAAILVSRGMNFLQAAPAAYPYRSSVEALSTMTDNPYQATTGSPTTKSRVPPPRWHGIALSTVSIVVGLFFGWQILVIYAFSTMVDPRIGGRERARMIADQFLFADGPFQIVIVSLFLFLTTAALIAAVLFIVSAVFRQPALKMAAVISCGTAAIITSSIVGYLAMQ